MPRSRSRSRSSSWMRSCRCACACCCRSVENAISANAYRPGDVLGTRKGLTVEIGNTDAEGRVILCDALALADEEKPDLLIDTCDADRRRTRRAGSGAARAVHHRRRAGATSWCDIAARRVDPLWRMPLWSGYDDELSSKIADVNNVSSSSILRRDLRRAVPAAASSPKRAAWVHLDLYGWNGKERPGRPVGAEPQTVRALYAFLKHRYAR